MSQGYHESLPFRSRSALDARGAEGRKGPEEPTQRPYRESFETEPSFWKAREPELAGPIILNGQQRTHVRFESGEERLVRIVSQPPGLGVWLPRNEVPEFGQRHFVSLPSRAKTEDLPFNPGVGPSDGRVVLQLGIDRLLL